MRRLMLLTAALASLAAPARAAPICPSAADQSAYEVLALREMMTVLATKNCGREGDYNNNFIRRFQAVIQDNDRKVQAYFRRVYGGAGRAMMDTFSTELVNMLSQQANRQAGDFCSRQGLMINELVSLRSQDELPLYAAAKALPPPGVSMCAAPARR